MHACGVYSACAGVGAGAGAAIFGELARTSTKKERTKVFSIFMAVRQLGLVIGKGWCLGMWLSPRPLTNLTPNFNLGSHCSLL